MKTLALFSALCLCTAATFADRFPGVAADRVQAPGAAEVAPMASGEISPLHQYLGTVQFTCTDFTAAGTGADILDRDNTGVGQEAIRLDVTDGNDTVIYTLTFQNALGTYTAGLINTTLYTIPPERNPITLTATSLAGNGFLEEVDVLGQGTCPALGGIAAVPTLSGTGLGLLILVLAALAILHLRHRRRTA